MKKVALGLLLIILVVNTTAFAAPQNSKPVSNTQQYLPPPSSNVQLMDSDELYNQIRDTVINKKETALDELEQEYYDFLGEYIERAKGHITEENRIILAKMMAYRYREAERVAQRTLEYISAISDSSKSISIQATLRTDPRVAAYYVDHKPVAQQLYQNYLYVYALQGAIAANAFRDGQFVSLVKTGGPWDLKQYLGRTNQYIFLNMTRTGEYIGNHHFGYMGYYAGYPLTYLKIGAGLYQVFSGTSKWEWISSYFDDPADQIAIEAGYNDHTIDFGKDVFW